MMIKDKVNDFYKSCKDFFIKRNEIAMAMSQLESIEAHANDALKAVIDNGFDSKYLFSVKQKYDISKFNSKTVQNFINKIDDMLFNELEPEFKARLEVSSLSLDVNRSIDNYSYCASNRDSKYYWTNNLTIDFIDNSSERCFKVSIPVKDSVHTDVMHWKTKCNGMYVVSALSVSNNRNNYQIVCTVFDKSKVVDAVRKYLNGEFDNEMQYDAYLQRAVHSFYNIKPFRQELLENSFIKYFDDGYVLRDSIEECTHIDNCIDDREEYISKSSQV